jgi:hypothetical protein
MGNASGHELGDGSIVIRRALWVSRPSVSVSLALLPRTLVCGSAYQQMTMILAEAGLHDRGMATI